jgi:hypothetical protein
LNWNEYVKEAKKTITFDTHEKLLFCTTTGLMGEWSEFITHLQWDSEDALIGKEIGDTSWYLAILSDFLNVEIELFVWDEAECRRDIILDGFITIGHIQETLKKVVRDNDWEIRTSETHLKLKTLLSKMYTLLLEICEDEGFNFSDILSGNIEKLADRAKRGVLQGSGD